jgi:hypothetical protein
VALAAQTLLDDVIWGNRGDTYWTATFTHSLPYQVTFTGTLGFYTYKKSGKYVGGNVDAVLGSACAAGETFIVNGCFAGNAPVSSGLRHLKLGISQPIASTGLTWSAQAIFGGENRFGVRQGNKGVVSVAYGF